MQNIMLQSKHADLTKGGSLQSTIPHYRSARVCPKLWKSYDAEKVRLSPFPDINSDENGTLAELVSLYSARELFLRVKLVKSNVQINNQESSSFRYTLRANMARRFFIDRVIQRRYEHLFYINLS